jgi:hypothetical protein
MLDWAALVVGQAWALRQLLLCTKHWDCALLVLLSSHVQHVTVGGLPLVTACKPYLRIRAHVLRSSCLSVGVQTTLAMPACHVSHDPGV